MYSDPLSVDFYKNLSAGHYSLAFQPVVSIAGSNTLYFEGLIRDRGQHFDTNPIVHLERTRRIRLLDASVVSSVLELLRYNKTAVIGCNISALSATMDSAWESLERYLTSRRDIASRLVIEITETAEPKSLRHIVRFIKRMHAVGCRIAIDDFGAGRHSTLEFLLAAKPDVIKIDRSLLLEARKGKSHARQLKNIKQECECISPVVILEGVETLGDYELARECGFNWVQGYYVGRPHLNPPQIPSGCLLRM